MNKSFLHKQTASDQLAVSLIEALESVEAATGIDSAVCYYDFPLYKDLDEDVVVARVMLASPTHGILLFSTSDALNAAQFMRELSELMEYLDSMHSTLFARMLRNKALRTDVTKLLFPIHDFIYAPNLEDQIDQEELGSKILIRTAPQLEEALVRFRQAPLPQVVFDEMIATAEGSKGLLKLKDRPSAAPNSKGAAVAELEKEIAKFDLYQKSIFSATIRGINRIRGLAGSGKTVVLAIKAALTHLKHKNETIIVTFHTKSLYQHIRRLVTRFYRQFDDKDPNWDKLLIMHAWGSATNTGVYYETCLRSGVHPLTLMEAKARSHDAFDAACTDLLSVKEKVTPFADFVFVDEGQDFPRSFLGLCKLISKESKLLVAYDELQTIVQPHAPSFEDVFGEKQSGDDLILEKCYRNPREVIVVSHALGFGIYGKRIVQMIENSDYWTDIGYRLVKGELKEGVPVEIERPQVNSLTSISEKYDIDEIVMSYVASSYENEVQYVVDGIQADLEDGLLPEDILVITVDDRHAKKYLGDIQERLGGELGVACNNMQSDTFSIRDFQVPNLVTLTTVYKAKGNESYSVYVVGVDALFSIDPSIRERNTLFTAMTRSKGWIHVSGVGKAAQLVADEIEKAKDAFPLLKFTYPSVSDIRIMKRDIREDAERVTKDKQLLDQLLKRLSPDEIQRYIEQKTIVKGKN